MYRVSHYAFIISCFNFYESIGQGTWDTIHIQSQVEAGLEFINYVNQERFVIIIIKRFHVLRHVNLNIHLMSLFTSHSKLVLSSKIHVSDVTFFYKKKIQRRKLEKTN